MSLRIDNGRELLVRLVGTEKELSQQKLVSLFRAFLMTRVKTYIARIMKENKINIFEIDEQLTDFSDSLKDLLVPDFKDYGIVLERFFVSAILKPNNEPQYEKYIELHFRKYADIAEAQLRQQTEIIEAETEAQKLIIDSKAQATKRVQEGYTYSQERGFNVAEKVADNEAVGQFTNMGVGFGTMVGVGGAVGSMVGTQMNDAMNSINNPALSQSDTAFCDNCGTQLVPGSAFCDECGTPVANYCKNCNYKFERPGKFCPKCGTKREV